MRRFFNRYVEDESGTTAVEFGIIAIGFLAMIFGVIEMGRVFMAWNAFQYSVENAARYALVNDDVTEAELTARIVDDMEGFAASGDDITVNITFPTVSSVNFVEINGTYDFDTLFAFLPEGWATFELTGSTRLPRP